MEVFYRWWERREGWEIRQISLQGVRGSPLAAGRYKLPLIKEQMSASAVPPRCK